MVSRYIGLHLHAYSNKCSRLSRSCFFKLQNTFLWSLSGTKETLSPLTWSSMTVLAQLKLDFRRTHVLPLTKGTFGFLLSYTCGAYQHIKVHTNFGVLQTLLVSIHMYLSCMQKRTPDLSHFLLYPKLPSCSSSWPYLPTATHLPYNLHDFSTSPTSKPWPWSVCFFFSLLCILLDASG